ncbi:MAG: ParB/RepB/Spo0J family partition protein, partial [Candidatus Firestonebacteria bacterium]
MPKGLGKGLGALIPESNNGQQMASREEKQAAKEGIYDIEISKIIPNKYQPRKEFNPEKLKDLVASIKEKGVIQPISVRKIGEEQYELIAGERRLRATKEAGLNIIPAIVKAVNDEDMLELALIENIQRDDLNSIEEAQAYRRLIEEFSLTHDDLSKKVGKDRSTITNILRLLNLPVSIQEHVSRETISMGHARVLLSLESVNLQNTICESVIKKGLSVRQTE